MPGSRRRGAGPPLHKEEEEEEPRQDPRGEHMPGRPSVDEEAAPGQKAGGGEPSS